MYIYLIFPFTTGGERAVARVSICILLLILLLIFLLILLFLLILVLIFLQVGSVLSRYGVAPSEQLALVRELVPLLAPNRCAMQAQLSLRPHTLVA